MSGAGTAEQPGQHQGAPGVRVGTSGFSFDDWVGPVYPKNLAKAGMLEYYEQALGFDTVELNYTYYSMPVPRTMESMVRRTGEDFRFVVRSHKDMTHDIWTDDNGSGPNTKTQRTPSYGEDDTRYQIPDTRSQNGGANTKTRRTPREGAGLSRGRGALKDTSEVFARFGEGIRPLVEAGRLGCVLIQMPSFFWPNTANHDYVRKLPERLPGVPLVVEFRNKAWVRDSTFRMLGETGMGYCVVDEPQLPRLMPFDPRRTSDIAYFRFHGRNQNWFKASREERYNYLYSEDELAGFVEPVKAASKGASRGFVFFNNCHAGSAARNAVMMKQLLGLMGQLKPEQQRVVDGPGPTGTAEPELPFG